MSATPQRHSLPANLLLWINILSLDAPLVALVWQDFFAFNFGLKLSLAARIVLALSIWLAYAADRWLDGWKIPTHADIAPRHRFAQSHRLSLGATCVVVFFANVALAWFMLPSFLFARGLKLVGYVAIYFFLNQWPPTARWLRGFKELAVGILFAAGTVVFILPRENYDSVNIQFSVVAWCLLSSLNCCAIAGWELPQDRAARQESVVTHWPFLAPSFKYAAAFLALFALLSLFSPVCSMPPRIGLAIATSALALATLDFLHAAFDPGVLRTSADLVLLTPIIFRFFP